jgi:tetratricopeptide (TPR) repeat protein
MSAYDRVNSGQQRRRRATMRSSQKAVQFLLILFISFGYPAVTNLPVIEGIVISDANTQGIPGLDYKTEADKAFEKGDYKNAITLYNNALDQGLEKIANPQNPVYESHLNIGRSMRWLGNIKAVDDKTAEANRFFENSIKAYDEAIKFKPNDSRAYLHKGISLTELGKFDEAIKQYDKAISFNPKDYMAHLHKGFALGELKQYDKSLEEYKKAKELGAPFDTSMKINEKARDVYYKGRDLRKSDPTKAIEYLKEAIKLDPTCAGLYTSMAAIHKFLGNHKEVELCIKEAMKVDPLFSTSYGSFGDFIYELKDNPQKCIHFLSVSLEVYPDSEYASRNKERIKECKEMIK